MRIRRDVKIVGVYGLSCRKANRFAGFGRDRAGRWFGRGLALFVFGEGEDVIIIIEDGKLGGAIEGLFETVEDGDLVFDGLEEITDIGEVNIEQQGAAIFATDSREGVGETFHRLEHHGDFAVGHHGPDQGTFGLAFAFGGHGHGELEAEDAVEVEGCVDVLYKKVGSEGFHGG